MVHKKKHWLLTEHLQGNPYLLTLRVVKFAAQHNHPIRRSAFRVIIPQDLTLVRKDMVGLSQQSR